MISANGEVNVQIFQGSASGNVVQGNIIGLDATGEDGFFSVAAASRGESDVGVFVNGAPGNFIGGPATGQGNLVSGNAAGIEIYDSGATGNLVVGNHVGLDQAGTKAIANSIGVLLFGAPGNTVGGTDPGSANVISGNSQVGVRLDGSGATRNVVLGNLIGLDPSGTTVVRNLLSGIFLNAAPGNTIGPGNRVVGSGVSGLQISTPGSSGNLVIGNVLGVTADGTTRGNGTVGIFLDNVPGTTIGGLGAGLGNLIAGNAEVGIEVLGSSATGNLLQGNTVRGNGVAGIAVDTFGANTIPLTGTGANLVTGSPETVRYVQPVGPQVSGMSVGGSSSIATLSLTFNVPMNAKRTGNRRGYRVDILNAKGKKIGSVAIASVSYDETTRTATIRLAKAVSASGSYRITAFGTGPHALLDDSGRRLDGQANGSSGSDYVAGFGSPTARAAIAHRAIPRARHWAKRLAVKRR